MLCIAHVKLMHQDDVRVQDAIAAVLVMECSMQGSALLGGINACAYIQVAREGCQVLVHLHISYPICA